MSLSLSNPGEALKAKIIKNKCLINNYHLADEIVNFLAAQYFSNVREIEGALNKIMIHKNILGQDLTIKSLPEIIADFIIQNKTMKLEADYIVKYIAKHFKLSITDLRSKKRKKDIVFARDIAIFLLKNILSLL